MLIKLSQVRLIHLLKVTLKITSVMSNDLYLIEAGMSSIFNTLMYAVVYIKLYTCSDAVLFRLQRFICGKYNTLS